MENEKAQSLMRSGATQPKEQALLAQAQERVANERRRYLMGLAGATGVSLALLIWLAVGVGIETITLSSIALSVIWVAVTSIFGFVLIASGKNRWFDDPSLTKPMILSAGICVLTVMHHLEPQLRAAPMPWLLMAFAFSACNRRSRFLYSLGAMLIGLMLIESLAYIAKHGHAQLVLWQCLASIAPILGLAILGGKTNDNRVLAVDRLRSHKIALDSMADAVISLSQDGKVLDLNLAATRLLLVDRKACRGQALIEMLQPVDDKDRIHLEALWRSGSGDLSGSVKTRVKSRGADHRATIDLECSASPVFNRKGELTSKVVVMRDVTDLSDLLRQLEHDSTHDELTGIHNRRGFVVALDKTVNSSKRFSFDVRHALLIIDLDQFKIINDSCGHEAGDALLKQVAQVLRGCVRDSDFVARHGGDEFAIILRDITPQVCAKIANEVIKTIEGLNFSWRGRRFQTGASVGVVMFDPDASDSAAIVRKADSALYLAKDLGRGRVQVHADDDEQVAKKSRELEWAARIQESVDQDLFELHAQLISSHDASHEEHFEILVRLRDGNGKLIPPIEFIPAAERFGLMPMLDRWVIRHALGQLNEAFRLTHKAPKIAINLSAQSIRDRDFQSFLKGELERCLAPLDRLCFELTETVAIADFEVAKSFIDTFRALGCTFALDDVGAGFNSFSYLKELTFDSIKIDGHYIRHLDKDPIDRALVESLVRAGESLGLIIVAEMVETDAIANQLKRMGVNHLQGFVVHRPESFEQVLLGNATIMRPSVTHVPGGTDKHSAAAKAPALEMELEG
jgi:diguanylate cyclase (GGDEF)-like protein/PAS domain S-box-containing protein